MYIEISDLYSVISNFINVHMFDKGLYMVRPDTGPIFLPSLNYAVDQIYTSFYFQEYTNYGIMRLKFTTVCIFVLNNVFKLSPFLSKMAFFDNFGQFERYFSSRKHRAHLCSTKKFGQNKYINKTHNIRKNCFGARMRSMLNLRK